MILCFLTRAFNDLGAYSLFKKKPILQLYTATEVVSYAYVKNKNRDDKLTEM